LQDAVARIEQLEFELKEARGTAERARVEAHEMEEAVEDRDRKLREAQQEIARMGEEQNALRYAASRFSWCPSRTELWTGRCFLLPQSEKMIQVGKKGTEQGDKHGKVAKTEEKESKALWPFVTSVFTYSTLIFTIGSD
jgi:hypothetical protein